MRAPRQSHQVVRSMKQLSVVSSEAFASSHAGWMGSGVCVCVPAMIRDRVAMVASPVVASSRLT